MAQQNNQFPIQPANAITGAMTPVLYKDNMAGYIQTEYLQEMYSFIASGQAKTGYPNLDAIIGKLYPGLYVLGAGSSLGKTTFLLQMADQLITDCEPVIYFTLEQSKLELVTKLISRRVALKCRKSPKRALTAIAIRGGVVSQEVQDALAEFEQDADIFTIVQGDFQTDMTKVEQIVEDYVKTTGKVPIIMIDYLQIIQEDAQLSDKSKIDSITKRLKIMQRKYNAVVMVISSINRANYMLPIDFESFKESGSIEYSADVVWGLQLQILNDPAFTGTKSIAQKRKLIAMAKAASPRKVELACLKNRYGIASYNCGFLYYPQFDLFTPDMSYKTSVAACPAPSIII